LNYKSFLDSFSLNVPSGAEGKLVTQYNRANIPAGDAEPRFAVTGIVPKNQAARFDYIGQDLNENQADGNAAILLVGGGQVLDGLQLKNVVFTGVHVVYKGGPLRMENVYFVNCRFDVEPESNGQQFAKSVLQSFPTSTFTAV
jgi:hypothetical protein